jgi:hypothetical protein
VGADLFADGGGVEVEARVAAGGCGGKAARDGVGGGLFEVVIDFVGDVAVGGVAVEEGAEAASELSPRRHGISLRL